MKTVIIFDYEQFIKFDKEMEFTHDEVVYFNSKAYKVAAIMGNDEATIVFCNSIQQGNDIKAIAEELEKLREGQ